MRVRRVLVTGGSGLIGAELVDRLRRAGLSVVALTHARAELTLGNGRRIATEDALGGTPVAGEVMLLRGDVRHERLGLNEADYARLVGSVDLIAHCAAITDFRLDPAVYPPVNTQGTANVIALSFARSAARGGGPIPMIYVSTAYVCGWRQGVIEETQLDGSAGFVTAYEESKYRAELLVRQAGKQGMPFVVVRPSIVVGASRTGRIREFHNIYAVLKLVTEGLIRALPGHYDATLDLVPIDYVADSIARLVIAFDDHAGRCFHLTNGRGTRLREFSDTLAEYPSMLVPRVVPPQSFNVDSLPPIERRLYLRGVKAYDGYFLNRVEFVNTSMLALLGDVPPPVHGKRQLRQLINYCEKVGFLGGSSATRRSTRPPATSAYHSSGEA
jgi:thioester reductase-like protein